jgi:phage terminase large subunit-like protein
LGVKPALRSTRAIEWCEAHLRIPEGRFVGQPLKVAPFMREDFRRIFDNPAGTRRAIISRGRKNAKTVETAMLMLLFLAGPEAKRNGQLYSAARSRDQASVLFNLAAKMVRMSPDLSTYVTIRDTAKELYCAELGTKYKALSAEASTAFGLSPVFVAHDELGQVKGPRDQLYDALETATAAQESPLTVIISTQAPTDADLLSVLIDDALTGADPRTVVRIDTAPPDMDPFSDEALRAANPAFDLFMNQQEVRDMLEQARRMPSRQSEYENLVLNRRVDASAPFVSKMVWQACAAPVADSFDGLPVYGGLDLSEVSDLTALVLVAPKDGVFHVQPTFWLPGVNLAEKARADRVPYDIWARDGFLRTTPGATVEYEFVAAHLRDLFETMDIRKIAFDRWNWRHMKPWLQKVGFREDQLEGDDAVFEQMGQGFQSMSPALRDLESALLNKRLAHAGHPVLTMCAANATVQTDPAGNRKLSKMKSHGRIDGMVALAMAMSVAGSALEHTPQTSPWDDPDYKFEAA